MVDRRYENGAESDTRGDSPLPPISSSPERGPGGPPRSREPPAGRVYVGNLPNHADRKTIEDLFGKFGRIVEVSIKRTISGSPFAFVEFQDPRDAQDAIQERDGYKVDGCVLRVEIPFAARGGGGGPGRGPTSRGPSTTGPPRRAEFRVAVKGLPPSGSWQDLKDHMREAGDCVYADVFRDGSGVVEFARREDMEYALRHFGDSKFRSHEGETSHITVNRVVDDDYDRRSMDRPRYRGRSPGSWEGHRGGYGRNNYDRGYDNRSYDKHYDRHFDRMAGERRGRSYSKGRRSASYDRRSRSRSRSFRGHR